MLLRACCSACADGKCYQSEEALIGITYLNKTYLYFCLLHLAKLLHSTGVNTLLSNKERSLRQSRNQQTLPVGGLENEWNTSKTSINQPGNSFKIIKNRVETENKNLLYYAFTYWKIQYMVLKFMAEPQWHHSKKSRHNKIEHWKSFTTNTTLHQQRNCTKIYKSSLLKVFINLVLQNLYTNRETKSYQ